MTSAHTIKKTCDRCKDEYERDFRLLDYICINLDNWYMVEGKLLCGSCYKHYKHILTKFMKGDL